MYWFLYVFFTLILETKFGVDRLTMELKYLVDIEFNGDV